LGARFSENGQYIFIDPKTMGVSSVTSRALGMGGYYNIYNVKGRLGRNGYTTSLKCKFNSSGICDDERDYGNVEDAEQPDDFNVQVALVAPEHTAAWAPGEVSFLEGSNPSVIQSDAPLAQERKSAHATYKSENRKTMKENGDNTITEQQKHDNFENAGFPELMERDKAIQAGGPDPGASASATAPPAAAAPASTPPPGGGAGSAVVTGLQFP